jgi:hypothetical protein
MVNCGQYYSELKKGTNFGKANYSLVSTLRCCVAGGTTLQRIDNYHKARSTAGVGFGVDSEQLGS